LGFNNHFQKREASLKFHTDFITNSRYSLISRHKEAQDEFKEDFNNMVRESNIKLRLNKVRILNALKILVQQNINFKYRNLFYFTKRELLYSLIKWWNSKINVYSVKNNKISNLKPFPYWQFDIIYITFWDINNAVLFLTHIETTFLANNFRISHPWKFVWKDDLFGKMKRFAFKYYMEKLENWNEMCLFGQHIYARKMVLILINYRLKKLTVLKIHYEQVG
jgi:hypothetical protein